MIHTEEYDIYELALQLLDGTISPQNKTLLESLCKSDASIRSKVREICDVDFACKAASEKSAFDSDRAFERFKSKVDFAENANSRQKKGGKIIVMWRRIAAVAVLLITVSAIAFFAFRNTGSTNSDMVAVNAGIGKQVKMNLPDGTHVELQSGSTMSYSKNYGQESRTVTFQGEGHFTIKHNEKIPFSIQTDEMVVNDIGTEFVFRNYDKENVITLKLISGSVALHNKLKQSSDITLHAGQMVTMNKQNGIIKVCEQHFSDSDTSKIWAFENTSVKDIANKLSQKHHIAINVDPSIANKRFSGQIDIDNTSIEKILDIMSYTYQIKYKKSKDNYILY